MSNSVCLRFLEDLLRTKINNSTFGMGVEAVDHLLYEGDTMAILAATISGEYIVVTLIDEKGTVCVVTEKINNICEDIINRNVDNFLRRLATSEPVIVSIINYSLEGNVLSYTVEYEWTDITYQEEDTYILYS